MQRSNNTGKVFVDMWWQSSPAGSQWSLICSFTIFDGHDGCAAAIYVEEDLLNSIKISKNKENMWVLHVLGWIGAEMLACGLATHFVVLEKDL
ncbi:hypothetical protein L1987_70240 [Smallanthus sonchifolius]|uniref:Uncharacterized protein n=1 Tax=Smallanthus sonchifolius TaxID=185202 RepID=A0ACB9APX6_9ASTR|nr:hypothetical protein L1987_70240 [Smallanthus sonchifolius]